ncbi:MAG: type III pantothenate kinase [Saprospiraceae bacterium]|nr:type III pantothenate kinase [Saprospiraceae bacterium]MDW8484097.1 type III pantothenate kinase [Saprospiraceae bacterium]
MTLVLDIGNTRIKSGLFADNVCKEVNFWNTDQWPQLVAYAANARVRSIVLATVIPLEEAWIEQLRQQANVWLELTHRTSLPFRIAYHTPHTLGRDRIAAVAGAYALWPAQNCLVIDCGTCIKYDILSAEGVYLGGNIAPGASMRLKAMHVFTAQLPLASLEMPTTAIGHSTITALQNGALRGAALEIEGFVRLFRQQFPNLTVILTGGDATFFRSVLPFDLPVEPHLTLYGLNYLLHYHTTQQGQP